jgi:hypothetical protein
MSCLFYAMKKPSLEAHSEDKKQEVSAMSEIELLYLYLPLKNEKDPHRDPWIDSGPVPGGGGV